MKKFNRLRNLGWLWKYKKKRGCSFCGENDPACLDFHHRKRSEKEKELSQMHCHSIDELKKEIEKCEILCSNCHRKLHGPDKNTLFSYELALIILGEEIHKRARAPMTKEQFLEMKVRFSKGENKSSIARSMKISRETVKMYLTGKAKRKTSWYAENQTNP